MSAETPPFPDNAEYVPDEHAEDDYNLDERPYQVMPPLSEEEYDSLRSSIRDRGVTDPIHVSEDMDILDGHHRVLAMRELGLWGDKSREPDIVVHGETEDHQVCRRIAWELNMNQRHLDSEEKKQLVERRLKQLDDNGEWKPNHEIGETLGVSESWVREVRRRLEGSGNIRSSAEITTDTDGRRSKDDADSKRESVKEALLNDPTQSNRSIAREHDVSHPFVGGVRDELGEPDVPEWWELCAKSDHFWSYAVPGGAQVVAFETTDEWVVQLRSEQFYRDRGLVSRGLNEAWCIARSGADSKLSAADVTERFATNVETFSRQKAEALRSEGYDFEYQPSGPEPSIAEADR
jgi:hypothetical protein